jgi:hypothetical protein
MPNLILLIPYLAASDTYQIASNVDCCIASTIDLLPLGIAFETIDSIVVVIAIRS